LNIPVSELNKDVVRTKLALINVDEAQIESFLKTLEESEFARYSNSANTSNRMNEVYEKSGTVITNIERGIR